VIERLLAAERALTADQLDVAERLFAQVAGADPRNAIAMTGLARVAVRRGDVERARLHVTRALGVDPDDAAAMALAAELGVTPKKKVAAVTEATETAAETPSPAPPKPQSGPRPGSRPAAKPARGPGRSPGASSTKRAPRKRGLLARLWRALLGQD
jgi:Tetratricopeptide repeat